MIGRHAFGGVGRALGNRNYAVYAAGNLVSLVGTWGQRVAVGWLTWELTESAAWLGIIAFAELAPSVLVWPLAGAAADRWDRLRLTKVSQALLMGQALALFGLTAAGLITIQLLLALTVFLGVVTAFNQPARLALIPALVKREDLSAAIAVNAAVFNASRFIGPALAGVLIVSSGVAAVFAVNALSFAAFLSALAHLRLAGGGRVRPSGEHGLLRDAADGLRYAAAHPGIAPLLLLAAATSLCLRPFFELLPGFADAVFQVGVEGLATMTATVGVGATVGAVWLAQREGSGGLTAVALGATLALTCALFVFALAGPYWVALAALAIAGLCLVTSGAGTQVLIQVAVDDAVRGRVLGLYGVIMRGGPALGALIMGGLADLVGLRWPIAAGALLAALAWAWAWSRRRELAHALEGGAAS